MRWKAALLGLAVAGAAVALAAGEEDDFSAVDTPHAEVTEDDEAGVKFEERDALKFQDELKFGGQLGHQLVVAFCTS